MKKILAILCAIASVGGALFFGVRLLNRFARTAKEDRKEKKARRVYTWEQGDEAEPEQEAPCADAADEDGEPPV